MAITTITNAMVSVNAIQGTLIADNAITAVHIATNAVSGTLIADNAVTATHIAQNTITVTQLADDAVEADKIADGVITTNHLNSAMISSQTEVTPVVGDFVLIGDTSDSNNLKKVPISGITALATVAGISSSADATAITIDSSENSTFTGDVTVAAGKKFTTASGNDLNIVYPDSRSLFIKEDSTTHVTVDNTGKVGIGITSPSSLLHMESGNAHNKLSITSTANGGTGYDAVIDLLGSASNSEVQFNMGINGDADREQIKTYQSVMTFTTNNVERMKIDTADIVLTTTGNANAQLSIKNSSASGQSGVQLSGYDDNHAMTFRRGYDGSLNVIDFYEYGNSGGDAYRWFTNGVQANQTQKLNLQTDGELIQGTAIADTYSPLVVGITADAFVCNRHSTSGSLGLWRTNTMEWKYYHNGMGYIMTFGSNGVLSGDFNDTSDVNLKENISSISDGTTVIKALRPVKFDWKASGKGNNQHGFIAQEVETVLPDAVEGNNYVENETGLPEDEPAGNGKTMNSNAVLAHAVKAIQELEARIKVLEG